jgi:exopolysaccharide production protein ExoZ
VRKLRSVQVLRGLAVTGAIASHAAGWRHGAAGVDLFFVISGVIIGKVMQGRSAGEFMQARLWRIYPIYWFNLLPLLAVALAYGIVTPARLASSLTLWPIWGSYAHPYLVPGWTLCFEMLFYWLIAAGLYFKRSWGVAPVLLAAILLNALTAWPLFQFVGNPLVLEFCAGLLILQIPKNRSAGVVAIILALAIFAFSPALKVESEHLMDLQLNLVRVAMWGVPASLAVYAALCFDGWFGKWADAPVFIGDASYSIYLSHYLVNLVLLIWWPARIAAMIVVGSAMYLAIERPIVGWRRKSKSGEQLTVSPALVS